MRFYKHLLATSLIFVCVVSLPLAPTGCKSPTVQRQAVNTLFTVGSTADAAYRSYLDLVVAGTVPTNAVPQVSKAYAVFQASFNSALVLVASNTNAVAPQSVLDAAAGVSAAITKAKKGN